MWRILLLFGVSVISGCSVSQVIDPQHPNDRVNGYKVSVTNYEKLRTDKVNLVFEVAPGAPVGGFDWAYVQKTAVAYIKEKGVKVSPSGQPVRIVLDGFWAWDRHQFPARKSYGTGLAGGSVLALGGSVAQAVAASLVESEVTYQVDKNTPPKPVCEDSQCVPEASFSVFSDGFETRVNLQHSQAFMNYVSTTEGMMARAIADVFDKASGLGSR